MCACSPAHLLLHRHRTCLLSPCYGDSHELGRGSVLHRAVLCQALPYVLCCCVAVEPTRQLPRPRPPHSLPRTNDRENHTPRRASAVPCMGPKELRALLLAACSSASASASIRPPHTHLAWLRAVVSHAPCPYPPSAAPSTHTAERPPGRCPAARCLGQLMRAGGNRLLRDKATLLLHGYRVPARVASRSLSPRLSLTGTLRPAPQLDCFWPGPTHQGRSPTNPTPPTTTITRVRAND